MNFNFVVFDCLDSDYYTILLNDLKDNTSVKVFNMYLQDESKILKFLFKLHYSKKIRKFINLPFKFIWNNLLFKNTFTDSKPICFLFSSNTYELEDGDFFRFIKKKYPNSVIVIYFRDLISITSKRISKFNIDKIKQAFDMVLTYNMLDAYKFDLTFFPDFTSKINEAFLKTYPKVDVIFIGKSKNRLGLIVEVFNLLKKKGLTCYFYVTDAPKEYQFEHKEFIFSKQQMQYREYLGRLVNAKIVLEIVQDGTIGFSTRTFEAIMYGKKLITNAIAIKHTRFFNQNVYFFKNVTELNFYDYNNDHLIEYNYQNEFSPLKTLESIELHFSGIKNINNWLFYDLMNNEIEKLDKRFLNENKDK